MAGNSYPLRLLYEEFIAVCESDLRASTVIQYRGSFKQLWKHFDNAPAVICGSCGAARLQRNAGKCA